MPEATHPPAIEDVCTAALKLPCSPSLLPRLSQALQSESSSTEQISKIIQIDPALASATIRLANSAYFGGAGRSVESVEQAIMRLGAKEIYRLAALALIGRWPATNNTGAQLEPGDFCRHALCCAIASEVLAETTEQVEPQLAYTSGLVHEMGKLAVAHACASFFPLIRACQKQRGYTWEQAEKEVLGYEHAEVGARLLRAWHFPELMVLAAEYQHRPTEAPAAARPLLAHLHAGRYIAASMGPGISEDGFLFEVNADLLAEWNFTSNVLEEAMLVAVERAAKRLGENLTQGAIKF
ncbi:MAG TPA: HDOD domain-containing protein [Lacunisphaera sp.]|jgi:HD-like signal output (HDOD) protein